MRRLCFVLMAVFLSCQARKEPPQEVRKPPQAITRIETREARRSAFATAYWLVREKKFGQAAPLLEALVDGYAELEDYILHYLALASSRAGKADDALRLWVRLAERHPRSIHFASAMLESGRILRARGDSVKAEELFWAARNAGDDEIRRAALFEIAEIDAVRGQLALAHDRLMQIRCEAPGSALGHRAKKRVEELRTTDPSLEPRGERLEKELDLLLKEGYPIEAIRTADRILAAVPVQRKPEIMRVRAEAELRAGRLEEALATLRSIAADYRTSTVAPEALFRYASILWNRDRDTEAESAFLQMRRSFPRHPRSVEALYALGRIAQTAGQTREALAAYGELARSYPASSLAREARWRIGWIHYRAGDWKRAADAFDRLAQGEPTQRAAEVLYWRARSLERGGMGETARGIYEKIASDAPESYYAMWAESRLGRAARVVEIRLPLERELGQPPPDVPDVYHFVRARELHEIGLRHSALLELRAFERANQGSPALDTFLMAAYPLVDGYRDVMRLRRGGGDPTITHPLAFWPLIREHTAGNGPDPLLVLALIRQESMFDPSARSHADARGLMQLLPSTAEQVALSRGRHFDVQSLYEPDVNIALGTAHFLDLLDRYGGDAIKALAAYNGGVDAVTKWEHRYGHLEPDEFVESISYRETRDYVKKVLAGHRRYQQLYGNGSRPASRRLETAR
jgi:soluble lytic murein transglycosylase